MKCLTDAILLDDFKTEVRRLEIRRIRSSKKQRDSFSLVVDSDIEDDFVRSHKNANVPNGVGTSHDPNVFQTSALSPWVTYHSGKSERSRSMGSKGFKADQSHLAIPNGSRHNSLFHHGSPLTRGPVRPRVFERKMRKRIRSQYSVSSDEEEQDGAGDLEQNLPPRTADSIRSISPKGQGREEICETTNHLPAPVRAHIPLPALNRALSASV